LPLPGESSPFRQPVSQDPDRDGEQVRAAMKEYGAVHLSTIGGAGALLSQHIVAAEVVAYEDLGTEAMTAERLGSSLSYAYREWKKTSLFGVQALGVHATFPFFDVLSLVLLFVDTSCDVGNADSVLLEEAALRLLESVGGVSVASEGISKKMELDWGKGFKPVKDCETVEYYNEGVDGGTTETTEVCNNITMGDSIAGTVNSNLSAGQDSLIAADEIDELIGAVISQIVTKALREGYKSLSEGTNTGAENGLGSKKVSSGQGRQETALF